MRALPLLLPIIALGGCTPMTAAVECRVDADCEAIAELARDSLQAELAQRVDRAIVTGTAVRLCMEGEPLYDVTLIDVATGDDVEVTIARQPTGELAACQY